MSNNEHTPGIGELILPSACKVILHDKGIMEPIGGYVCSKIGKGVDSIHKRECDEMGKIIKECTQAGIPDLECKQYAVQMIICDDEH